MWAQDESRILSHNYVGTEQLLLGAIDERSSSASKTLASLGANRKSAREKLLKLVGYGSDTVIVEIPFTAHATKVLELARELALELDHKYVEPDHLLIAILDEGKGRALKILADFEIDLVELRKKLVSSIKISDSKGFVKVYQRAKSESEHETDRRREFLETFLNEVRNIMIHALSIRDALFMTVNIVGKIMKASRCIIIRVDGNDDECKYFEYFQSVQIQSCEELGWAASKSELVAQTLLSDAPISISSPDNCSDCSSVQLEMQAIGVKSALGFVLRDQLITYGCLILQQCDESNEWTEDDIEYLQRMADTIAAGLLRG